MAGCAVYFVFSTFLLFKIFYSQSVSQKLEVRRHPYYYSNP